MVILDNILRPIFTHMSADLPMLIVLCGFTGLRDDWFIYQPGSAGSILEISVFLDAGSRGFGEN